MVMHKTCRTALGELGHLRFFARITNGILVFLVEETEIHMGATAALVGKWFGQARENNSMLGPSLMRMIKTLEKSRLITKRNDKTDGRRSLISITPKAKALIKEITPESVQIYRDIESSFGANEMERLLDLLEAITRENTG
jgi:DNA-binding MarR family transcriptional regulator